MGKQHANERQASLDAEPRILARADGPSIAYHRIAGRAPGVMFLTGFMSDMDGQKALALDELCREREQAYLRFDYRGHGQSEGLFEDADIETWFEDALDVFDRLTEGPQVLVGSSMGGWLMLLLAVARPERVKGLVGIAAAPDFTEGLLAALTPEHRALMAAHGKVVVPSSYGDDYIFTRALLDKGRQHCVLTGAIPFDGPVRLLHGMKDDAVPYQTALRIEDALVSNDVEIVLIKDGDHRLSRERDLARLKGVVTSLLDSLS